MNIVYKTHECKVAISDSSKKNVVFRYTDHCFIICLPQKAEIRQNKEIIKPCTINFSKFTIKILTQAFFMHSEFYVLGANYVVQFYSKD